MTTDTWIAIPSHTNYQMNQQGQVRTVDGNLVTLTYLPDSNVGYYNLKCDLYDGYTRYQPDNLIDDFQALFDN